MLRTKNPSIITSYKGLRKWIGILGMLLPFICMFGGCLFGHLPAQQSISHYYHTNMRDFFVGLLFGVSLFLITYKGYEHIDNVVTTLTGLAGFGIALFPCLLNQEASCQIVGLFQVKASTSDTIHMICALAFFFLLAMNSIFLFTLTDPNKVMTKNKKNRNRIYRLCGIVILASLASLAVLHFVLDPVIMEQDKIMLWFEMIMLLAFGFSWLTKGEAIFGD